MQALEIVPDGENSRLVDLFDTRHARKVLTAFGRAFGAVPEKELGSEQNAFLDQAVAGLAQDGKIISVRLALFAEMVKGKPWTPATLKEVGGTAGVGATFLEETFAASTAPPQHRLHQKAAQAVLKALLPEAGSDIKGHMRSQQELLEAAGYSNRPKDFDDLLRVLDSEIRLITPTDPEGKDNADPATIQAGGQYYQLTHDYLVSSLRDWLTRKQRETRRGRAELRLTERSAAWNSKPENRHLPAWWEWANILLYTRKRDWTPPQWRMMRRAGPYHVVRGCLLALALVVLAFAGWWTYGALEARAHVKNLLTAKTADVLDIIRDLKPYRRWANPLLRQAFAEAEREGNEQRQLKAGLALLAVDSDKVKYLQDRLLHGDPEEVLVIRQALLDHKPDLTDEFWDLLENATDPDKRFHAACALAAFAPDDLRWKKARVEVAGKLAAQKPFEVALWTKVLKPIGKSLLPPLAAMLEDEKRNGSERGLIATIYGSYAADDPGAYVRLEARLDEAVAPDAPEEKKLELTKKQANIGVGLLVMDRGTQVWPRLKHSPDPTLRSFLIERMGSGGVDARTLLNRLDEEKDTPSIRHALLLSLGEYSLDRLPPGERQNLLPRMVDLYRNDPDPGIHGAARWLLKQWQAEATIKEIDAASRAMSAPRRNRSWSVNGQGQTMVLIPKPPKGVFWMGEDEERHEQPMGHDFAMSAEAVTVEQFRRFRAEYHPDERFAPTKDCPAIEVSWYDAAAYCNWLSKQEGIAEAQWCYEIKQGAIPTLAASTVGLMASVMGPRPLLAAALVFPARTDEDGDLYGNQTRIKAGYLRLQGYRLPTEAEWEYACRAGSRVAYSFGEPAELLERYGWYDRNSWGKSHPCGTLKPNDLGLFDMHGNIWQWMQDTYTEKVAGKEDDRGGLVERASVRVIRGGSWLYVAGLCRAAYRSRFTPVYRVIILGFRLARVPVEAVGK
jgi:formylglycine-generating enzyme required for sulfatase activity